MGSAVQAIVEVGRDLIAVKAALGHGRFLAWIGAEFQMSEDTARQFTRVAGMVKSGSVPDLPATIVVVDWRRRCRCGLI